MSFRPTGTPPKPPTTGSKITKPQRKIAQVIIDINDRIFVQDNDKQGWTMFDAPPVDSNAIAIVTGEGLEMKDAEKLQLYKDLAEFYGEQHQCLVCIEEMAELTKELVKYERGHEDQEQFDKIAEEIADVEIMLEQVKRIYDVEADVCKIKDEKLKRTRARLDLRIK